MSENDVEYEEQTEDVKSDNVKTVELYDAAKGKVARTGGPYLDEVEAHNAETWRAQREGREPDYDNPPAVAGTQLVPMSQLVERDVDKNHFSDALEVENEPVTSYEVDTTSGFEKEPDPTQPNFDNNYDRLNALNAGVKLSELKDKAGDGVNAQGPDSPEKLVNDTPNSEAQLNNPNVRTDTEVKPVTSEDGKTY